MQNSQGQLSQRTLATHWIALRFVCARLSSIVDIPQVELECSISVFRLVLSGDVRRNVDTVSEIVYAKGDAKFPTGLLCAYVAHVWRQFSTDRKWNCSAVL